MDLSFQTNLTDRLLYPPATDFVCILLFSFNFFLLYQRSILYTKNVYFHTSTLDWHVNQISSMNFFLSNFPLFEIHYISAVLIITYECELDILLPLLFPLPFAHTISLVFFLHPSLSVYISPFSCISVQILYGTCNSI